MRAGKWSAEAKDRAGGGGQFRANIDLILNGIQTLGGLRWIRFNTVPGVAHTAGGE